MSELKKLTTKQKKFCRYYVITGNATKSALKAGYAKNGVRVTAHKLLTNTNILNHVHARLENYFKTHSVANPQEILQFYTNVVRARLTEDSIGSTQDGYFKIKKRPDIKDRISAANELMKRYDPLVKAKIQKVNAESKIKQLQAQQNDTSENKVVTKADSLLNAMENAGKKNPKKD